MSTMQRQLDVMAKTKALCSFFQTVCDEIRSLTKLTHWISRLSLSHFHVLTRCKFQTCAVTDDYSDKSKKLYMNTMKAASVRVYFPLSSIYQENADMFYSWQNWSQQSWSSALLNSLWLIVATNFARMQRHALHLQFRETQTCWTTVCRPRRLERVCSWGARLWEGNERACWARWDWGGDRGDEEVGGKIGRHDNDSEVHLEHLQRVSHGTRLVREEVLANVN